MLYWNIDKDAILAAFGTNGRASAEGFNLTNGRVGDAVLLRGAKSAGVDPSTLVTGPPTTRRGRHIATDYDRGNLNDLAHTNGTTISALSPVVSPPELAPSGLLESGGRSARIVGGRTIPLAVAKRIAELFDCDLADFGAVDWTLDQAGPDTSCAVSVDTSNIDAGSFTPHVLPPAPPKTEDDKLTGGDGDPIACLNIATDFIETAISLVREGNGAAKSYRELVAVFSRDGLSHQEALVKLRGIVHDAGQWHKMQALLGGKTP